MALSDPWCATLAWIMLPWGIFTNPKSNPDGQPRWFLAARLSASISASNDEKFFIIANVKKVTPR